MFLLDTNCWIQLVRSRSQADEVREFLRIVPTSRTYVSIYTVHSIGIIMLRHNMMDQYASFLMLAAIDTKIAVVGIPIADLGRVADACTSHRLDFDDAYQYVAAEMHGLKIVSLDADFDRTPNGRLTPTAALQSFMDEKK